MQKRNGKDDSVDGPVTLVEITPKKWGHEECFANTEKYCGKVLKMKRGWKASLHRHPIKDETFYLYKGEALLELWDGVDTIRHFRMSEGDTVHIASGTWHRLTAIQDCTIIEASTHHSDNDVERRIESCLDEEIVVRHMNRKIDHTNAPVV